MTTQSDLRNRLGMIQQRITQRFPVQPRAEVQTPALILDARQSKFDRLAVLLDHHPTQDELRYAAYPVPDELSGGDPFGACTLYVAEYPGGYVTYLYDDGSGRGFDGKPFDVHLTDGTTRVVVGPWRSNHDAVASVASVDLYPGKVAVYDDAASFNRGRGGWSASLTRASGLYACWLAEGSSAARYKGSARRLGDAAGPP